MDVRVSGEVSEASGEQSIRMSLNGGGPAGMEVIFRCNERGLTVTLWNPFANKWQVVEAELLSGVK